MSIEDLSFYILNNKDTLKPFEYLNNSYLSIITSDKLEIYSPNQESILAFIGSDLSTTTAFKLKDNYEGEISKIEIQNTPIDQSIDSATKCPSIDFLADKIFIKWKDTYEVLTPHGSSVKMLSICEDLNRKNGDSTEISYLESATNIAVIDSKRTMRISSIPWPPEAKTYWEAKYFSQFPDSFFFFMYRPIINKYTLAIIDDYKCKPFIAPYIISKPVGVKVSIDLIMKDHVYFDLFNKYTTEEGYYFKYDDNDFELINLFDYTNAIKDTSVILEYLSKDFTTDAHKLLDVSSKLLNATDESKAVKLNTDSFMLQGKVEYLRYPPLHRDKGIYFYNKFSNLTLNNFYGILQMDRQNINIQNQQVTLENLENVIYEYPSIIMPIDYGVKPMNIKGKGHLFIEGDKIVNYLFEDRYALMFSTIATFICFIITLISLHKGNIST